MSFDPAFLDLMPSTLRVSTMTTFNDYAEEVYSTGYTSYRCRIEYTPTIVRNSMGEEVVSTTTVYVASTTHLPMLAQYSVPDGSGNWLTPDVQTIAVHYDEDGVHHNVVYLGAGGG